MTKKNILWIALLAILIVILILSKEKENVEKRSDLFKFKTSELKRIEIVRNTDSLNVILEGDVWMMTSPRYFPAKQQQVQRFFDDFLTLTVSSIPASEAYDMQSVYQVDEENAMRVTLFGQNDKILSKVFFGMSQTSPAAYIRKDNDYKIYQIDNVFSALNPTNTAWRDDKVVNFTSDQLMEIAFTKEDGGFEISQKTGMWMVTTPDSSSIINPTNQTFINIQNSLTNLRTTSFFDDEYEKYAENLDTPALELFITLLSGETTHLKIAPIDSSTYVLQKDGIESSLYRLTSSQWGQLNIDPARLFE